MVVPLAVTATGRFSTTWEKTGRVGVARWEQVRYALTIRASPASLSEKNPMDMNPLVMLGFMANTVIVQPLGTLVLGVLVATFVLGIVFPPIHRLHRRIVGNPLLMVPAVGLIAAKFGLEHLLAYLAF